MNAASLAPARLILGKGALHFIGDPLSFGAFRKYCGLADCRNFSRVLSVFSKRISCFERDVK